MRCQAFFLNFFQVFLLVLSKSFPNQAKAETFLLYLAFLLKIHVFYYKMWTALTLSIFAVRLLPRISFERMSILFKDNCMLESGSFLPLGKGMQKNFQNLKIGLAF